MHNSATCSLESEGIKEYHIEWIKNKTTQKAGVPTFISDKIDFLAEYYQGKTCPLW